MEAKRAQLEAAFGQDPPGDWPEADRRTMLERLAAVLPDGSSVRSCECRSSLCRIETGHANLQRYNAFARAAFMRRPTMVLNRPGITVASDPAPDGSLVAVAFLAREGHSLPPDP
jgi:hypothetical protein